MYFVVYLYMDTCESFHVCYRVVYEYRILGILRSVSHGHANANAPHARQGTAARALLTVGSEE